MTTNELREAFQRFYEERGHLRVPGHSLIPPAEDQSTLFIIAGMQQFKPYFLRTKEPPSNARRQRAAVPARRRQGQRPRRGRPHRSPLLVLRDDGQLLVRRLLQGRGRRLRVGLGDRRPGARARAPLGDGARGRSRARARRGRGRDRRLAAQGHPAGAHRAARQGQLLAVGRDRARAASAPRSSTTAARSTPAATRTAGRATATGSWRSTTSSSWRTTCSPGNVLVPLPTPNVDTGNGIERTACVLQDVSSVFDTDGFRLIMDWVERESGVAVRRLRRLAPRAPRARRPRPRRQLPDRGGHRAVERRARLHLPPPAAPRDLPGEAHRARGRLPPARRRDRADGRRVPACCASTPREIERIVRAEEEKFAETLARGMKVFDELAGQEAITADDAFALVATYGFPIELAQELAEERGQSLDIDGFRDLMESPPRDLARRAARARRSNSPRSSSAPTRARPSSSATRRRRVLTVVDESAPLEGTRQLVKLEQSPVLRRERRPGLRPRHRPGRRRGRAARRRRRAQVRRRPGARRRARGARAARARARASRRSSTGASASRRRRTTPRRTCCTRRCATCSATT